MYRTESSPVVLSNDNTSNDKFMKVGHIKKSRKVHLLLLTLSFTINWPDRKHTSERRRMLLSNAPPAKVL